MIYDEHLTVPNASIRVCATEDLVTITAPGGSWVLVTMHEAADLAAHILAAKAKADAIRLARRAK